MNFQAVVFEFSAGRADQLPKATLPEIVFSGRSNVGKSSLINKLVNRKAIARVSATPGKTATVNFFRLPEMRLVDLPGYGYAKVSQSEKQRWARLMNGFFESERRIALVVQLCDLRHAPTQDDLDMIDYLEQKGLPFLVVCTKADKLKKTQFLGQEKAYADFFGPRGISFLPFSSANGLGLDELKEKIESAVLAASQAGCPAD